MIKVLNAYCGIGGNRKLWTNVNVTAIELNPKIAKIYQDFFPQDKVIITDAHTYLLEHFKEYDFIWSSPPCQSHSRLRRLGLYSKKNKNIVKPIYPDMKLYEEILFLKYHFKGKWIIENVISYYKPLIKPYEVNRHYFWANFIISNKEFINEQISTKKDRERLTELHGFNIDNYSGIDKRLCLRNCVNPKLGLHVFNAAFKDKQTRLITRKV